MQRALEVHGQALGKDRPVLPDAPAPHRRTQEVWLSPTKMGLRYGEVCAARTAEGALTLVRISGYRAAANRSPDKRAYRRWHGIDLVAFLMSGVRHEIRIAQVLKRSRC